MVSKYRTRKTRKSHSHNLAVLPSSLILIPCIHLGYFIRHRNRRLQVTQIRSQGDKNDASFMMTDAYTGGATSVITETEQACRI